MRARQARASTAFTLLIAALPCLPGAAGPAFVQTEREAGDTPDGGNPLLDALPALIKDSLIKW